MAEASEKATRWAMFWRRKAVTTPESPNSAFSRGSKRERLRQALRSKLKFSKAKAFKAFPPADPTFLSSFFKGTENRNCKSEDGGIESKNEKQIQGLDNAPEDIRGAKTEGVVSVKRGVSGKRPATNFSQPSPENTLFSKIRSKWAKPEIRDVRIPLLVPSSRSIAFLHEMQPGITTTEVSYTNA